MSNYENSVQKESPIVLSSLPNGFTYDDYVLLDCVFGIPLFNSPLNKAICSRMISKGILELNNRSNIQFANRAVIDMITELLNTFNYGHVKSCFPSTEPRKSEVVPPITSIYYDPVKNEVYT
ncbi:hypothetical protein OSTOST_08844 [Ostertagia ostertagi]